MCGDVWEWVGRVQMQVGGRSGLVETESGDVGIDGEQIAGK